MPAQQLPLWRDWATLCALCYRQPIWAAATLLEIPLPRLSHGLSAVAVSAAALAVAVPRALPPTLIGSNDSEAPFLTPVMTGSQELVSSQALKGLVQVVAAAPLQQGYPARLVSLRELTQLGVVSHAALQEAGICLGRAAAAR